MAREPGKSWRLDQAEIERAIAHYCSRQGSQQFDPNDVAMTATADGIVAIAVPRRARGETAPPGKTTRTAFPGYRMAGGIEGG